MNEELKITEIEVSKINLSEGDVLMITVNHDDVSQGSLELLSKTIKDLFPNNKTMVFGMGSDGAVKFTVASQPNISYCSDCGCGKKERAEALKGEENV